MRLEGLLERRSVDWSDVGVGDEDVGRGGHILYQVLCDVVLPEAVVDNDGLFAEDGHPGGLAACTIRAGHDGDQRNSGLAGAEARGL